jgi:hypothetical protein
MKMLPPSSATAELEQPLPDAALRRLRVFVRRASFSDECCFVLRQAKGADGSLKWQREY